MKAPSSPPPADDYDVIIIGSGFGGSTAALRLTEKGYRVAVLEAGRRVNYARRFHNNAVADVRRVRSKPAVRLFRLAGHAALPSTIEFDDSLPSSVGE